MLWSVLLCGSIRSVVDVNRRRLHALPFDTNLGGTPCEFENQIDEIVSQVFRDKPASHGCRTDLRMTKQTLEARKNQMGAFQLKKTLWLLSVVLSWVFLASCGGDN